MNALDPPALQHLPETRRKVLEALKRDGPLTADLLGRALGITAMGVRQHLAALERDGHIQRRREQRGKGRPSHVYALTAQGDALFPRSYAQFVHALLDAAREAFGVSGVAQLFARRNSALEAAYKARLAGKSRAARLEELARIRTEEGYMASATRLGPRRYQLVERNCAICAVAQHCPEACAHELALFRRVLPEAEIVRQTHIVAGERTCTYLVCWPPAVDEGR